VLNHLSFLVIHGYKGYKVLDLETIVISVIRNLVFPETVFPFKDPSLFPAYSDDLFPNTILPLPISELFIDVDSSLHSSSSLPSLTSTIPTSSSSLPHTTVNVSTGLDLVNLDRPRHQTKVPSYLYEYHCSFIHQIPQPLRSSNLYPLSFVLSYTGFSASYQNFTLSITTEMEPRSFAQAINSDV